MEGWIERVNHDPHYNWVTAMDAKMALPKTRVLNSNQEIKEAIEDPLWNFRAGMAIERVQGPEVTFHAYYTNNKFSCRTISINDNELLTGGMGPELPENASTIFTGTAEVIEPIMDRLIAMAEEQEGPYTGFIAVTVVFKDGVPYYRDIQYGATMKFIQGIITLYDADISTFFTEGCEELRNKAMPGYAATLKLWAYPYEIERNRAAIQGGPGLEWDGESWIAYHRGARIKDVWRELYGRIGELALRGVCFRVDGEIKARRIYNEIMRRKLVQRYTEITTDD